MGSKNTIWNKRRDVSKSFTRGGSYKGRAPSIRRQRWRKEVGLSILLGAARRAQALQIDSDLRRRCLGVYSRASGRTEAAVGLISRKARARAVAPPTKCHLDSQTWSQHIQARVPGATLASTTIRSQFGSSWSRGLGQRIGGICARPESKSGTTSSERFGPIGIDVCWRKGDTIGELRWRSA